MNKKIIIILFLILVNFLFYQVSAETWTATDCSNDNGGAGWDKCVCNGTQCESCTDGYSFQTWQLRASEYHCCAPECLDCEDETDGTICLNCKFPGHFYSPSDSACIKCQDNCEKCITDGSGCEECVEGYYKDGSNTCQKCSDNCEKCRGNNVCYDCEYTYYITDADTCEKCPDHCEYCYLSLGQMICERCDEEDRIINPTTMACDLCSDNCRPGKCEFNDSNVKMCTRCDDSSGYIVNPEGQCIKCPENCLGCFPSERPVTENTITKCNQCTYDGADGYYGKQNPQFPYALDSKISEYLNSNDECVTCEIQKCVQCKDNGETVYCNSCDPGFEFTNIALYKEDLSDFDEVVKYGYYYNSNLGTCSQCPNGCRKCEESNQKIICTECFQAHETLAHYIDDTSNMNNNLGGSFGINGKHFNITSSYVNPETLQSCIPCPEYCSECAYYVDQGLFRCLKCGNGYSRINHGHYKNCTKTNQTPNISTKIQFTGIMAIFLLIVSLL